MSDYPTEEELEKIRNWDVNDNNVSEFMAFVKSIWWMPDWGWREENGRYSISTGGWSGNEDIIGAMMSNRIFWLMFWEQSRRGGHYIFSPIRIPISDERKG